MNEPTQPLVTPVPIPAAPPEIVPEPSNEEIITPEEAVATFGAYGQAFWNGYITGEEYNPNLQGKFGLAIYDEMRKSDATVKASLDIIGLPIIGADYDVAPGSDDPKDVAIAEQLKWNLFEKLNFRHFLREALTHLPFGFAVFEKVYEYDVYPGNADGVGKGIYLCLDKLAFRKQSTILSWLTSNKQPGITQQAPNATRPIDIPASKLLIYTHQREGSNHEGISLLRSSYKPWFIKSQLEKISTIAAERQGVGVPYFKPAKNAAEPDKVKAREAMRNLRTNEQSYLEVPEGWEVGMLEMKAGQNFDVSKDVQYNDRQILVNVLGQFLTIGGQGMSGSYAASSDQTELIDLSRMAIANTLLDDFNNNVVKQWVDLNFTVNKYPKVTVSKIANDNIAGLAEFVSKLSAAGALTNDAELEDSLRKRGGLPLMPDDIKERYDELHKPAAPVVVNDPNPPMPAMPNGQPKPPVKAIDGIKGFHSALSKHIAAMEDETRGHA